MSADTNKLPDAPRAILFDLDGTLVDSAPDIAASVNELLAGRDLPPLSLAQVKSMIGNGLKKLVERAFAASQTPLTKAELEDASAEMAAIYRNHLTELTELMPGAQETIAQLHVAGFALGVVTNKPQVATRQILLHFGLTDRLGVIVGGDAVSHMKPAPDSLLLALERLGVEPAMALMVGDSVTDFEAARAAGVPVALVRGGYSKVPIDDLGADLVCESLLDLPAILRQRENAA
ncbi:phosphoglycolate phosphatase [Pseudaminobacter arsenicus]|uniref:Phosphoglycolate phosphatase n=1 Tax=Borborobacter arsenicus TaxID=1851146 RepID=A0A432V3X1_9HYPH|nr:phosphoglycolate phosphatase [Pseudaminobacter arsenicus]RUM96866.1 phosphoglycolate phosphatase [Pseudaminobacter arsenicus]